MVESTAPSNIALIKYMGKTNLENNLPTNRSFSYTLSHLITKVRISPLDGVVDTLTPLDENGFSLRISEKGRARFLSFFSWLKTEFRIEGNFAIQSGNNFPSDCGLASSASSFAALTKATQLLRIELGGSYQRSEEELSVLSQRGSGSSCRSFFSPFAEWKDLGAKPLDLGISQLRHSVLIFEEGHKTVSSSEAHRRVTSSLLFEGRAQRAESRFQTLTAALISGDWQRSYEICWEEFFDMHALFETSRPSFGYMNSNCMESLNLIREQWQALGDGPLVTMDAGPNIHLLFRPDQMKLQKSLHDRIQALFPSLRVISHE